MPTDDGKLLVVDLTQEPRMTQHQGLPVHGYVPQSDHAIALVNENKNMEERMLCILDELADDPKVDMRWLAIGRTHLEMAFMAINRSIFRPKRPKD
jgi:hypothetical protein